MTLRIGFMGTPDFALEALRAIVEADFDVVCVYSQPPRPKGRGQKLQPSPVHEYAAQNNIAVFTPKSLKSQEACAEFAAQDLDVAVVAAYGLILPKTVLEAPKFGCINIHASLLPRWRGASPIQRAIWAGDEMSGVCLMQMDEGLDTGPEISRGTLKLTGQETASSLRDDLAKMGAGLIVEALRALEKTSQKLPSAPQPQEGVTYAHLLKKEDGKIDWSQSAQDIDRQIRALNPWPGTYSGAFKIKAAKLTNKQTDQLPGTILDKDGHIACGAGSVLRIEKIQPANKQAMDFASAMNGGYVALRDVWP